MGAQANHAIATPRNSFYPEPSPHEQGTYPHTQSISYSDSATHTPPNGAYDPNSQYMYAQTAGHGGHVTTGAAAQSQTHAHHPHPQTRARPHGSMNGFASQQPPATADMMWRFQVSQAGGSVAGHSWQDWTAAVVDNQDRYSANALMSLGAATGSTGGQRTSHSEGMNDNMTPGDLGGIPVSVGVGVNGVNGTGGSTVPTTSAHMQWPLLLFSDPTGVSG